MQRKPESNMKIKLPITNAMAALLAALALAIFSTVTAIGQDAAKPAAAAPAQTTPAPAEPGNSFQSMLQQMLAGQSWIDPAWVDPDVTCKDLVYDRLALIEVTADLRKKFDNSFDVLLPSGEGGALLGEPISLQLRNIKASEVFNAMNLMFENDRTPLRWELKMNGQHRLVLLRVLEEPKVISEPKHEEPKRNIFFVGDLINEKSGFPTVQKLAHTVSDIFNLGYSPGAGRGELRSDVIRFHEDAQLLIVTGPSDQIQFVGQTLAALRDKVRQEQRKAEIKEQEQKPKLPENKPQPGEKPH